MINKNVVEFNNKSLYKTRSGLVLIVVDDGHGVKALCSRNPDGSFQKRVLVSKYNEYGEYTDAFCATNFDIVEVAAGFESRLCTLNAFEKLDQPGCVITLWKKVEKEPKTIDLSAALAVLADHYGCPVKIILG